MSGIEPEASARTKVRVLGLLVLGSWVLAAIIVSGILVLWREAF